MNSEPKFNLQEKFKEIQVEISNDIPINEQTSSNVVEKLRHWSIMVKNWFITLPPIGKIVVGLFGISVCFSLLKTVLSLLQLLFSLAILGVVGYGFYHFALKSSDKQTQNFKESE